MEFQSEVRAHKCQKCGRLHEEGTKGFISIWGNVCRGMDSEIIGNNLDEEMKVASVGIFCHPYCVAKVLKIPGETYLVR